MYPKTKRVIWILAPLLVVTVPHIMLAANTGCPSWISSFGGLFDWVPSEYCTANGILLKAINLLLMLAGGVAVLFIILGGFRYLTSAGNGESVEKGKNTLVNAVIGLTVILLSSLIVRLVTNTLTNSSGGGTGGGSGGGGTSNEQRLQALQDQMNGAINNPQFLTSTGRLRVYVGTTPDKKQAIIDYCTAVGYPSPVMEVVTPDNTTIGAAPFQETGTNSYISEFGVPGATDQKVVAKICGYAVGHN